MLRIALLVGILVHLLGFFFFRVLSNPLPSRNDDAAFVALVSGSPGLNHNELMDQASLFDSSPLFIPTQWSSTSLAYDSTLDEEIDIFPNYGPDIELLDEVKPVRLALDKVAGVEQSADLLDLRFWALFNTFGEGETQIVAFEEVKSLALVRVLAGGDGLAVDSEFRFDMDVRTDEFGDRPVVYYLLMSGPGLPVGAPVLHQTSGSDTLDAAVLEWITRPATLAVLPAGYLEMRVFP